MLKYEKKLHLDRYYGKLQSDSLIHKAISPVWGIAGFALLYYLIKYALTYIPDIRPWNSFEMWLNIGGVQFIKSDIIYFICGLIGACYGSVRLSKTAMQNHSAKTKERGVPNKLLTNGCYAKVRHPMYGTFIILQAGFMLSLRSIIGMLLALILIFLQYINAGLEEKKQLIPLFGDEYYQYAKKVRHVLLTRAEGIVFALAFIFSVVGFVF